MKRVAELDLLRFIAATMVVIYHYAYRPEFGILQEIATYGYLGVPLFFLISGFVILWSAEGRTASGFARSRFLRLYPMFWLGMAMTLTVLIVAGRGSFSLYDIAANATILPGYLGAPMIDGVYWTLAVEFKFYVLMFFAVLLKQIKHIEYWLYAWLVALFVAMGTHHGAVESLTIYPHGFFFVGGALCYLIQSRGFTALRLAGLTVCAVASVYEAIKGRGGFTWEPLLAEPTVVAATIAAFYGVLLLISAGKISLPGSRTLVALGALTYPLYLLHNQIGKALFAWLNLPVWLELAIVMTIVYALAWTCAKWLEPNARGATARVISFGWRAEPQP